MHSNSCDKPDGNGVEQQEAGTRTHSNLTDGTHEETLSTVDKADGATTTESMLSLNQSVITRLVDIIKGEPTVDLWLHLREISREYKNKRKPYINESPSSENEDFFSNADPVTRVLKRPKTLLPTKGDITVVWPLSAHFSKLLQHDISDKNLESVNTEPACISRSALLDVIQNGEWIFQEFQTAVVRIAPNVVVKICRGDGNTTELSNLQHIQRHSSTIPVPQPLGMLKVGEYFYTFTSFVDGVPLDHIWTTLSTDEKATLQIRLNVIFTELRSLPLPSKDGLLGGGDPPLCHDQRRWTRISPNPISNEAQFNEFLLSNSHAHPRLVDLVKLSLTQGHRIVMTHGDLHPRNILVKNDSHTTIAGIIDWEHGGAYPEYWEYIKAIRTQFIGDKIDWDLFLPDLAIGIFTDEYIRDRMIDRMVT